MIAKALNRNQSTISREIIRNTGLRGYRHKQADDFTISRHQEKAKKIKLTDVIRRKIDTYIKQDWSPEQITGRFKIEGVLNLHHETIYRYILSDKKNGGMLYKHLRHQNKTYRKRYGSAHTRNGIVNRVDIDKRPDVVNQRERIGDWEGDTIIGKNHKGAIVTLDERRSKLRLAAPLATKKAGPLTVALTKLLEPVKGFVCTITFDNGKEFAFHEKIAEKLSCNIYFAKPYHSWERGQNENANGLLRQYFPKAMELVDVKMKQVIKAIDKLNSRPRKCLQFRTPYEAFQDDTGVDVKKLLGYALMT
ncbi:MAG: IS30 family transposase [Bacteroidetes bacterium]|nr:IS30 family transposase [Bacteroidota bacterium]